MRILGVEVSASSLRREVSESSERTVPDGGIVKLRSARRVSGAFEEGGGGRGLLRS